MDEDVAAINSNTKNQKIKDFFVKFKKQFIFGFITFLIAVFSYFIYVDFEKKK